jgi:peptide/nickel transport system substrate-binding protein
LPRIFGIFFNQNKSVALRDPAVREALDIALDRGEIVEKTMSGYGVPIASPIATLIDKIESSEGSKATTTETQSATSLLDSAGWLKNNLGLLEKQIDGTAETLSFTLRTSNTPFFSEISEIVVEDWKAVGVDVAVEQFEQTDLVQSVIRPRDFEALLFGLDMNRSGDLYPFWHSSQKDDPGLNIAQYTNLTVDTLLEAARTKQDEGARTQALGEASALIAQEKPALFLFKPRMTYVVKNGIIVGPMNNVAKPSDRFSNIDTWYTDSDNLWNIFKN